MIVLESIRTDDHLEQELENVDSENDWNLPCDNDKLD